nr:uncharacterized protein LOC109733877 [Aegilops tauschii subsp. strangulata]
MPNELVKSRAPVPANRHDFPPATPSSSPLPLARRRRAFSPSPPPPRLLPPPLPTSRHIAAPRISSGFRGVRLRPSGVYYAKIRSDDSRLILKTFEAARAYDATAWRLGWPRSQVNFSDVRTRE